MGRFDIGARGIVPYSTYNSFFFRFNNACAVEKRVIHVRTRKADAAATGFYIVDHCFADGRVRAFQRAAACRWPQNRFFNMINNGVREKLDVFDN